MAHWWNLKGRSPNLVRALDILHYMPNTWHICIILPILRACYSSFQLLNIFNISGLFFQQKNPLFIAHDILSFMRSHYSRRLKIFNCDTCSPFQKQIHGYLLAFSWVKAIRNILTFNNYKVSWTTCSLFVKLKKSTTCSPLTQTDMVEVHTYLL